MSGAGPPCRRSSWGSTSSSPPRSPHRLPSHLHVFFQADSEPVTKTIEELLPLHKEDEASDDDDDGEEEIGRDVEEEEYSFPPIELSVGANAGN